MENTRNTNEYAVGLIIDEMDGSLSTERKLELEQWRSADPENERIYSEFYSLNQRLDVLSAGRKLDVIESWDALEGKLEPIHAIERNRILRLTLKWSPLAASIVLIAAFGIYLTSWFSTETVVTAANEIKTVELPDGSTVTMNGGSELQYNKAQFKQSRYVSLVRGEAFFDVVHRPADKLVIDMGTIRLTDLGTSFNVTRSGSDVNVIVATGKVALENTLTSDQVQLKPGMRGTYYGATSNIAASQNTDENYKAWADKNLTFNNTPLPKVAELIGKIYKCQVKLVDPSLATKRLTGKLGFRTADSALVVVGESLGLKVLASGNDFTLSER